MTNREEITNLARYIDDTARMNEIRAADCLAVAKVLRKHAPFVLSAANDGECQWKSVKGAELTVGTYYVIRRADSDRNYPPCLARWGERGWKEVFGTIPDGGRDSHIEVWMP